MEDIASRIQTYHLLFVLCLILAILCLITAIILFFALNISEVFGYLTGSKAKRQILALEESSAASGRLMARERSNMHQMAQGMKDDMGIIDKASPGARVVENIVKNDAESVSYHGTEDTSLLGTEHPGGADNTSLLGQQPNGNLEMRSVSDGIAGGSSQIAAQANVQIQEQAGSENVQNVKMSAEGETGMLSNENVKIGAFVIEKEIILLHAEDVI